MAKNSFSVERFLCNADLAVEDFENIDPSAIQKIAKFLNENILTLEATERLESLLKHVLAESLKAEISGCDAREICTLLCQLGLLFKYKPYAVKAASPFGYSIFLQYPNQGFSFQNHLEHKTEVFHILEVLPGGYVFLCRYSDWQKHYEPNEFRKWLNGKSHPFFDKCRFFPQPGDTFVISELGVVHTVIGCILEEFATISTDMVQRLYDQNDRDSVATPARNHVLSELAKLQVPKEPRLINLLDNTEAFATTIEPTLESFGRRAVLTDSFVRASHYWVKPEHACPIDVDPHRVTVIRVFTGQCEVYLFDHHEYGRNQQVPPINASQGDIIVIPKQIYFQIQNAGNCELVCSEHRIRSEIALI